MTAAASERMRSDLAIAAAISLVIHLIVGIAVFGHIEVGGESRLKRSEAERDAQANPPDTPEEPKRPRLRLGIERSSHASVTWLGFDTPEDHQVTEESKVEQAALARQDVSGMRAGELEASGQEPVVAALPTPAPVASTSETPPLVAAPTPQSPTVVSRPVTAIESGEAPQNAGETAPVPPTAATSLPSPVVVTVPATGSEAAGPARDEELTLTDKIGPKPPEVTEKAAQPVESPAKPDSLPKPSAGDVATGAPPEPAPVQLPQAAPPTEASTNSDAAPPVEPTPGPEPGVSAGNANTPGEGDAVRVGIRSDKESPASALKRALKYRPGKPVAVQGLELATVEPRFPVSVRLTSNPRNPVLVIHFDRKGVVTRADFLKDEKKGTIYNTGEPAVDEPLRTAIFQWRAKGEELLRIPADNPDATVSIVMEIVLNGR